MRWLIRILAVCCLLVLLCVGGFFWYLETLPTVPPQQVSATPTATDAAGGAVSACLHSGYAPAFAVRATVTSQAGDKTLYSSLLNFRVQLQTSGADRLAGVAADIRIQEAGGAGQTIADMPFLSRASGDQQLVFNAFNNLGLMAQHPMSVLAQVLKDLSIGNPREVYRFAYDGLQRNYRYRQLPQGWQRQVSAPGATQSETELQPVWQVQSDGDCLPQRLLAEEIQPLTIGDQAGSLRFRIEATRIAAFRDLSGLDFSAQANAGLHWQLQQLVANGDDNAIVDEQSMWQAFADFARNKNVAQLKQAAAYLVNNVPVYDLAAQLNQHALSDAGSRDLIFALGLLKNAHAEEYLLDLLGALPSGDNAVELQKVRIMVAVSGNGEVSEYAYQSLAQLAGDDQESANIRNNALINLGSVVQQMDQQGQDVASLRQQLSGRLLSQMQSDDAAAAIFSAGNAGLATLSAGVSSAVEQKLTAGNAKERYAAATVLSRDTRYYDQLIQQLQQESSPLVSSAIVAGLDASQLTAAQRDTLTVIAAAGGPASGQVAQLLN